MFKKNTEILKNHRGVEIRITHEAETGRIIYSFGAQRIVRTHDPLSLSQLMAIVDRQLDAQRGFYHD